MGKGGDFMKVLHMVAYLLLFVGGINWGLVGLFQFNLVGKLLGPLGLERVAYILVGLATVYAAFTHMGDCKTCSKK
jgi:uncharacterized membrane protein YuzA (DUF378 family)